MSPVKVGFCDIISDSEFKENHAIHSFFSYAFHTMEVMSVYALQAKIYVALLSTPVIKAATEYQRNQFPGGFLISSQLSISSKFSTILIFPRMYVCFLFKPHLLGSKLNVLTIVRKQSCLKEHIVSLRGSSFL